MLKKSQRVAKNLGGGKRCKKSKNRQKCGMLKNMFKKHVLQHIFYSADLQEIRQKSSKSSKKTLNFLLEKFGHVKKSS